MDIHSVAVIFNLFEISSESHVSGNEAIMATTDLMPTPTAPQWNNREHHRLLAEVPLSIFYFFFYFQIPGLLGGQSGTEKTEMCCGSYPSRFPFTTGIIIFYS